MSLQNFDLAQVLAEKSTTSQSILQKFKGNGGMSEYEQSIVAQIVVDWAVQNCSEE